MKKVKLTQAVGRRAAGEVLEVDEASAKSLVETKKVAEYFDPKKDDGEVEARTAPRLGDSLVYQVADAREQHGHEAIQDEPPADDGTETAAAAPDAGEGEGSPDPDAPAPDVAPDPPAGVAAATKPKGRPSRGGTGASE